MKWNLVFKSMKGRVSLVLALSLATVMALIPSGEAQTYKVIHRFTSGKDGIEPNAGLVLASDGSIWGTTYRGGGSSDTGTVFKIDRTGKETVFTFPGCCGIYRDGGGPEVTLVRDAAGNLYGTTFYGGTGDGSNCGNFGCGTIFKLDTSGKETVLHSFVGTDGSRPRGKSDPARRQQSLRHRSLRRGPFALRGSRLRNCFQAGYSWPRNRVVHL